MTYLFESMKVQEIKWDSDNCAFADNTSNPDWLTGSLYDYKKKSTLLNGLPMNQTYIILSLLCLTLTGCVRSIEKYEPTYESLSQFECPEWFRDAKLGFWSHWGPQSAAEQGDWYARGMYIPKGQPGARGQYEYHVEHYGHPSEFGYKDVIKTWKAEKLTPEYADSLMRTYKKAGAIFFVTTVHHHDNFDLWDSKTHRWNPMNRSRSS